MMKKLCVVLIVLSASLVASARETGQRGHSSGGHRSHSGHSSGSHRGHSSGARSSWGSHSTGTHAPGHSSGNHRSWGSHSSGHRSWGSQSPGRHSSWGSLSTGSHGPSGGHSTYTFPLSTSRPTYNASFPSSTSRGSAPAFHPWMTRSGSGASLGTAPGDRPAYVRALNSGSLPPLDSSLSTRRLQPPGSPGPTPGTPPAAPQTLTTTTTTTTTWSGRRGWGWGCGYYPYYYYPYTSWSWWPSYSYYPYSLYSAASILASASSSTPYTGDYTSATAGAVGLGSAGFTELSQMLGQPGSSHEAPIEDPSNFAFNAQEPVKVFQMGDQVITQVCGVARLQDDGKLIMFTPDNRSYLIHPHPTLSLTPGTPVTVWLTPQVDGSYRLYQVQWQEGQRTPAPPAPLPPQR